MQVISYFNGKVNQCQSNSFGTACEKEILIRHVLSPSAYGLSIYVLPCGYFLHMCELRFRGIVITNTITRPPIDFLLFIKTLVHNGNVFFAFTLQRES